MPKLLANMPQTLVFERGLAIGFKFDIVLLAIHDAKLMSEMFLMVLEL